MSLQIKGEPLNPLKVAIKGDGTDKKAFEIIKHFESMGFDNVFTCPGVGSMKGYFYGKCGIIKYNRELPEGYTEISLKEDKQNGLMPDLKDLIESYKTAENLVENILRYIERIKELETDNAALCKELTEIKLKLKDLSK